MRVGQHVARPLEHHVLEEMREPGPPRSFVLRADPIHELQMDDRRGVILGQDHRQTVVQCVELILKPRRPHGGLDGR